VNWRPRSSMRQGAKSKRLEHPAMRSMRYLCQRLTRLELRLVG
jgi:hypothetical protein